MQLRRSFDPHRRSSSLTFSPGGIRQASAESAGLMHNYDVEHNAFGLTDLVEDPEEQSPRGGSPEQANGGPVKVYHERPSAKSMQR